MPPSKSAKKAAKKAPHKAAKHHGKHHESKELRKAYEHLGRLGALEAGLSGEVMAQVKIVTALAEDALLAGDAKSAADLLRAAEHLAFGSLAVTRRAKSLSDELEEAIHAEYEHLVEKAEHHWEKHEGDRPEVLEGFNMVMRAMARTAFEAGAYRRALEFARGREALAHVHGDFGRRLEEGAARKAAISPQRSK